MQWTCRRGHLANQRLPSCGSRSCPCGCRGERVVEELAKFLAAGTCRSPCQQRRPRTARSCHCARGFAAMRWMVRRAVRVVLLRSWVRRSACPGRQQRLRTVLHLAFLVDAQRLAGTGPRYSAPSRQTTDLLTRSRCGGVSGGKLSGFGVEGPPLQTWSAGWVAPGGVSRPPNHVGDVVVAARPDEVRREGRQHSAKRWCHLPSIAAVIFNFASLLVSPRLKHGAASQHLCCLAAPPEALELLAFLVRQLSLRYLPSCGLLVLHHNIG